MKLYVLFGLRKGFEDDAPEVVLCWDEYCVYENQRGWIDANRKVQESGDWSKLLLVELGVSEAKLEAMMKATPVLESWMKMYEAEKSDAQILYDQWPTRCDVCRKPATMVAIDEGQRHSLCDRCGSGFSDTEDLPGAAVLRNVEARSKEGIEG